MLNIPRYKVRDNLEDHLNTYKMKIDLRDLSHVWKYRAFHLTLFKGVKLWYNKNNLYLEGIRS